MTSPVPPINPGNRDYRIGDAERQEAMDALGKHFTAGRLDVTEYDNRLASITNAVMQSDLAPVFADLPHSPTIGRTSRSDKRPPLSP